ncbi:hypothetical protein MANES_05G013304v8 [Manihot esculenta]|uniref:Uncharacterized protein n=1 Tax=Manihot esculenta TaxID=3983 RepID=A0ACB7HMD0_MANES|nr:hypothetical protein MANES_05G013304v8 [Manihot esculenta]
MERFFKKMSINASSSSSNCEVDIENISFDTGLQSNVMRHSLDVRNQVCEAYLLKGSCQPCSHKFSQRVDGNRNKRFIVSCITKDATYCLYCYLFLSGRSERGHDSFVTEGFTNRRKKERLREHVGDHWGPLMLHNNRQSW